MNLAFFCYSEKLFLGSNHCLDLYIHTEYYSFFFSFWMISIVHQVQITWVAVWMQF